MTSDFKFPELQNHLSMNGEKPNLESSAINPSFGNNGGSLSGLGISTNVGDISTTSANFI